MASNSAVEFGFQTDIVNLTQLTHLITGRALKALSDGGIDFYAVAAAMWLGKRLPIQTPLQSTVHSHLQMKSKTLLNGFLAKTLSIGWGHSAVPLEMSRTKAGTNALLLIGALSVGSPSSYNAAECLSELMSLYGCEADIAPTVDAIKPIVVYLAPFVQDLGFPKVLQHIVTTTTKIVAKQMPERMRFLTTGTPEPPVGLITVGESSVLAAAIKQLVFTSQNGEKIHFITRQRGAWLAAFASHVLGMEVSILLDDQVLWASSGSNGTVVFDVDPLHDKQLGEAQRAVIPELHLVDAPSLAESKNEMILDFAIPEALGCELARYSTMDETMKRSIECAIGKFSRHSRQGSRETLNDFGILPEVIEDALASLFYVTSDHTKYDKWHHGFQYLNLLEKQKIQSICSVKHEVGDLRKFCACASVGNLILGFATSIVALLHCRYDRSTLRVSAAVLNGSRSAQWTVACKGGSGIPISKFHDLILDHLDLLIHVHCDDLQINFDVEERILGVSIASNTVCYTFLIQDDCHDDEARLLTILPGRACVQGLLRPLLIEPDIRQDRDPPPFKEDAELTTLPSGTFLEPHHRPTETRVFMNASLMEHTIAITSKIGRSIYDSQYVYMPTTSLIKEYLSILSKPCGHNLDNRVQLRSRTDNRIAVCGFDSIHQGHLTTGFNIVFVALKGQKLEQMMYLNEKANAMGNGEYQLFWQLHECLSCLVADAQKDPRLAYIIMAG